ncbi:MAG: RNA methyltransferase [Anaerolineales bacterium]
MITSTGNPLIKQVRSLRQCKVRRAAGLCYAEGLRIVAEAIHLGAELEMLLVAPELLVSEFGLGLVQEAHKRGLPVIEVSESVFKSIALKEGPQGLAAVVRQRWHLLESISGEKEALWVALSEVADPGNLGTILRTADAVGAKGIILLDDTTDPYDPTAIRASMGAVFSQMLVRCSFQAFAVWKAKNGFSLVGTSDKAEKAYRQVKYPERLILLMGSERHGLTEEQWRLCDVVVRIPMIGRSDSLNLAVATGIVLYEIFHQRYGVNTERQPI